LGKWGEAICLASRRTERSNGIQWVIATSMPDRRAYSRTTTFQPRFPKDLVRQAGDAVVEARNASRLALVLDAASGPSGTGRRVTGGSRVVVLSPRRHVGEIRFGGASGKAAGKPATDRFGEPLWPPCCWARCECWQQVGPIWVNVTTADYCSGRNAPHLQKPPTSTCLHHCPEDVPGLSADFRDLHQNWHWTDHLVAHAE
jgi:hypothetical protein